MTIELTLELTGSMLEMEDAIQKSVNELGLLETREALKQFDTDGESIVIDSRKLTSKGEEKKNMRRLTER